MIASSEHRRMSASSEHRRMSASLEHRRMSRSSEHRRMDGSSEHRRMSGDSENHRTSRYLDPCRDHPRHPRHHFTTKRNKCRMQTGIVQFIIYVPSSSLTVAHLARAAHLVVIADAGSQRPLEVQWCARIAGATTIT